MQGQGQGQGVLLADDDFAHMGIITDLLGPDM
jgi:hypothetical protein